MEANHGRTPASGRKVTFVVAQQIELRDMCLYVASTLGPEDEPESMVVYLAGGPRKKR